MVVFLAAAGCKQPAQKTPMVAGPAPSAASSTTTLEVAGPLAVAPDGLLYVVDRTRHEVLVRRPNGQFSVAAGDGASGFSGDGGKAVDAALSEVSDIAFSPGGDLYLADGPRVREINQDGVITTVAGDGGESPQVIGSGTPARDAALGAGNGLSIAFSTGGDLYIGTEDQLLRLTRDGRLDPVQAVIGSGVLKGKALTGFDHVALDGAGDVYSSCGQQGWAIYRTNPKGRAGFIAYARRSGGSCSVLQRGPGGAVYGENGPDLLQLTGHDPSVRSSSTASYRVAYRFPEDFWLTYFAFGPNGVMYADEIPGGVGFETRQQLVEVSGGHLRVLWQEAKATAN
jgi:hypothetical protein